MIPNGPKRFFLKPISMLGVLPIQTSVHASKMPQTIFVMTITKGECCHSNSSAWLQMVPNYFYYLLAVESTVLPNSSSWLQMVTNDISHAHHKGGVLPIQTLVYDSKCCKWSRTSFLMPIGMLGVLPIQSVVHDPEHSKQIFAYPLARGQSYPPKL